MEEFQAKCPLPKPPGKFTKDGWVAEENDPTYQQVMAEWGKKRLGYIVTRSLEPSNIEWDTVKLDDPRTWANWETDLIDGGLTQIEANRVLALVMEANSLDEAKLSKAREVFLLVRLPCRPNSLAQLPHRRIRRLAGLRTVRHPAAGRQGILGRVRTGDAGPHRRFRPDARFRRERVGAQLAGARMPWGRPEVLILVATGPDP